MPTYAYACKDCSHAFEIVQSFTDSSLTSCPECQGTLRKKFNSVGVVFKGSGFYRTDSRDAKGSTVPGPLRPGSDSGARRRLRQLGLSAGCGPLRPAATRRRTAYPHSPDRACPASATVLVSGHGHLCASRPDAVWRHPACLRVPPRGPCFASRARTAFVGLRIGRSPGAARPAGLRQFTARPGPAGRPPGGWSAGWTATAGWRWRCCCASRPASPSNS